MAIQSVLPPKRLVEVISVDADFSKYLLPLEGITAANCQVFTFYGTDLNPSAMLYEDIVIVDTVVSHKIRAGIAGNVYIIQFRISTDLGRILDWFMKMAILPNEVSADDIFIDMYFTTPPYPLYFLDSMESTGGVISGYTWKILTDGIESIGGVVSGELRPLLLTTDMLPEGIDSTSDIVSGALSVVLIQYTMEPEGIDSTGAIISGELDLALIQYTNWRPEGILSAGAIISGSLV